MKTVWKWVIGIVVVLVVVAVLVGGAFLLRSHMMNVVGVARQNQPGAQVPGSRTMPFGNNGNGQPGVTRRYPGMMPFGNGAWGMYGMMGFGRMTPFGGLFGGLVMLGILALIVLAIIWLVGALRKPAMVAAPVAAVAPVVPAVAMHPCQKCGEPVQENWKFCPNCGKKL
jgi:hypothetical protein